MTVKNCCFSSSRKKITYNIDFSINDVPKNEWDVIASENIYLKHDYLRSVETGASTPMSFVYVQLMVDDKLEGICYFQLLDVDSSLLLQKDVPFDFSKKLTHKLLDTFGVKVMVCGNLFSTGANGFLFNKEKIAIEELYESIQEIVKTLNSENLNNDKISFVLFKEYWEQNDVFSSSFLEELNYKCFQIDVNMVLFLKEEWNCFDDYLSSMKTKYRTRAKNVLKKTNEIKVKSLNASEISFYGTKIEELYSLVSNASSFNIAKFCADGFVDLKEKLSDQFIFNGFFLNDELVAFSSGYVYNQQLDANYVGFNYILNQEIPLYQKILYTYVENALAYDVNELRLGRTAELIKSSIGAVPKPMNLYVKHRNLVSNRILRNFIAHIKPNSYEIRKPFKR